MKIDFKNNWSKDINFSRAVGILFIIGIMAYTNAIFHPFVHDDIVFIKNNPRIAHWDDVSGVFLKPPTLRDVIPIANTYYRPFLEIFYKIEYSFFGLNPYGFHFCNMILHIINSILIYLILALLIESNLLSLAAAVLFLIHPVQSEAVACISGISNLLYTAFLLVSLAFYLYSSREEKRSKEIPLYILSLVFFACAFFTKEQALVLPFLLVLYEGCFFRAFKKSAVDRYFRLAGILILASGYLWFRKIILKNVLPDFLVHQQELWLRLLSIPHTLLGYLGILFWPVNLHYYRCADILRPFQGPLILLIGVILLVIFVVRSLPREDRGRAIFGLGWFLISLLPVLNIIPMVEEYSFVLTAEHFLYLPLVGFLIFVLPVISHYLNRFFKEKGKNIFWAFLLAVSFIFVALTIKQNTYWAGEIPLFQRSIQFEKRLSRVHTLLAKAYYFHGEFDNAIKEYSIALDILQGYAKKVKEGPAKNFYLGFIKGIHFDLAHCFEAKNDFPQAIEEYREALAVDPRDGVLYNNLGIAYLNLNDLDSAFSCFKKALALNPNNLMAMNNLALCHIGKKNFKEAEGLLRKALLLDPHFVSARQNLERLLNTEKSNNKGK